MRYPLALMLLMSCNARPELLCPPTTCGLGVVGNSDGEFPTDRWSCDAVQRSEDAFVKHAAPLFPNACRDLKGVRLYFMNTPNWQYFDKTIAGQTSCALGMVTLSSHHPYESAFCHEMFHVAQHCTPPAPTDEGLDWQHSDWRRSGVIEAIARCQSEIKN